MTLEQRLEGREEGREEAWRLGEGTTPGMPGAGMSLAVLGPVPLSEMSKGAGVDGAQLVQGPVEHRGAGPSPCPCRCIGFWALKELRGQSSRLWTVWAPWEGGFSLILPDQPYKGSS